MRRSVDGIAAARDLAIALNMAAYDNAAWHSAGMTETEWIQLRDDWLLAIGMHSFSGVAPNSIECGETSHLCNSLSDVGSTVAQGNIACHELTGQVWPGTAGRRWADLMECGDDSSDDGGESLATMRAVATKASSVAI